jgi:hypothetical protein
MSLYVQMPSFLRNINTYKVCETILKFIVWSYTLIFDEIYIIAKENDCVY